MERGSATPNTEESASVAGYEVLEHLDSGGSASVWLARKQAGARPVVLKIIRSELAHDEPSRRRFKREAAVTARLHHRNIASTFDAGETGDGLYLAMEYVPGCSLADLARRWSERRLPAAWCVAFGLKVLDALVHMHETTNEKGERLGLVHRDLSPRNVMVSFEGRVKVIDFGLVMARVGDFRTATATIAGTARYMSPEQATVGPIDQRSDLYTLGATLYELMTGRPVAPGRRLPEIVKQVLTRHPAPMATGRFGVSEAVDRVIRKALAKKPSHRFPDARSFRAALREAAASMTLPSEQEIGASLQALYPAEYQHVMTRLDSEMDDTLPVVGAGAIRSPWAEGWEGRQWDEMPPAIPNRSRTVGERPAAKRFA